MPLSIAPIARRLPQYPLRKSMGGVLMTNNHVSFPTESEIGHYHNGSYTRQAIIGHQTLYVYVCKTYHEVQDLTM